MGSCGRGFTVVILIVLSAQVFLTTCIKNPFLLEYFDAVTIAGKIDEYSASLFSDYNRETNPVSHSSRVSSLAMVGSERRHSGPNNNNAGDVTTTTTKTEKKTRSERKEIRERREKRMKNREKKSSALSTTPQQQQQFDDQPTKTELQMLDNKKKNNDKKNRNKNNKSANTKPNGEEDRQRVVILAGPHKTASTTLQSFFADLAHESIRLTQTSTRSPREHLKPHPSNPDWVFPVGIREEYAFTGDNNATMLTGSPLKEPDHAEKFYALLASFASGRRLKIYFPEWNFGKTGLTDEIRSYRTKTRDYFRALLKQPWDDGKNLVIAAEAFDTLVEGLVWQEDGDRQGEDLHVEADSGLVIGGLLDVFPWDRDDPNNPRGLSLDDFEVHMNLRTPRISHAISIWHQLGKKEETLRTFFHRKNARLNLYQINTLAMALQFVRKGVKVTILDMAGVKEKEAREEPLEKSTWRDRMDPEYVSVVGGLQGVVACEILRMGHGVCDETSKIHLKGFQQKVENHNVVDEEHKDRNLNETQMEEIGRILDAYDCSVWQHLKKYQDTGKLRILYPSEHLFETCSPGKDPDISFRTALDRIQRIAWQDNGIPFQLAPKEIEQPIRGKNGKPRKIIGKEKEFVRRHEYLSNPPI